MNKYPIKITDEVLNKLSHISDETIQCDIRDTKREVDQLQAEYNLYRNTTDKMEYFRQSSRLDSIHKRKEFIEFLLRVVDKRKEKCNGSS